MRVKAMREASSRQTGTNSQPAPSPLGRRLRLLAGAFASCAWVALASAVAGDALADPMEAAELLDVEVDQRAGVLALADPMEAAERPRSEPDGQPVESSHVALQLRSERLSD